LTSTELAFLLLFISELLVKV